jgi:hypothetical protein
VNLQASLSANPAAQEPFSQPVDMHHHALVGLFHLGHAMSFQMQLFSDKGLYEHLGPGPFVFLGRKHEINPMPGCPSNPRPTQVQALKGLHLQLHFSERNPEFITAFARTPDPDAKSPIEQAQTANALRQAKADAVLHASKAEQQAAIDRVNELTALADSLAAEHEVSQLQSYQEGYANLATDFQAYAGRQRGQMDTIKQVSDTRDFIRGPVMEDLDERTQVATIDVLEAKAEGISLECDRYQAEVDRKIGTLGPMGSVAVFTLEGQRLEAARREAFRILEVARRDLHEMKQEHAKRDAARKAKGVITSLQVRSAIPSR